MQRLYYRYLLYLRAPVLLLAVFRRRTVRRDTFLQSGKSYNVQPLDKPPVEPPGKPPKPIDDPRPGESPVEPPDRPPRPIDDPKPDKPPVKPPPRPKRRGSKAPIQGLIFRQKKGQYNRCTDRPQVSTQGD